MIYKFDKNKLTYIDVTKHVFGIIIGSAVLLTGMILLFLLIRINDVRYISQETRSIIINEATKANEFSPEKLRAYILDLNIRFPRIVYAQARIESGNFQSNIFRANRNLFGMRLATTRPSTNKGQEAGFAIYTTWRESVQDYAMFSAAYLNNIKTEDEYFQYLAQNYDNEDKDYVKRLKEIIAEEHTLFKK